MRRAFLLLAVLAGTWAGIASVTGGVQFDAAGIHISARNPTNPLLIALIGAVVAWMMAPPGARSRTVYGDVVSAVSAAVRVVSAAVSRILALIRGLRRSAAVTALRRWSAWFPPLAGAVAVAATVAVGVTKGAFVAGGSDSYGYVSQAHLWATATLDVDEPLMREMRDSIPAEAFAPPGYRPSLTRDGIVPAYAPGFPMVMAIMERAGGRDAVFYALPLLAGVAVWATYLLGRAIAGPAAGAAGAVLVATSPAFLFQLTGAPLSDIPAAAWWTLALVLVAVDRTHAVAAAGIAAGLAILTRPNLVPMAIAPALLLAWPAVRLRRVDRAVLVRSAAFAAGVVGACLIVATVNAYWYGSPTASGYGPLDGYFSWQYPRMNLARYPRWLAETQTPLVALALLGPFLVRPHRDMRHTSFGPVALAVTAASFASGICGVYLFYTPYDVWWVLRFLLPAYPVLMVFVATAILGLTPHLTAAAHRPLAAAIIGLLAWYGVDAARARAALDSQGEMRYATIGRQINERLPQRAVLLAMQHGGSARFYSGRTTIRWDLLPPSRLDGLIEQLQARGNPSYILLDGWEVELFRSRFSGTRTVGSLDSPPIASVRAGDVRIFDASGLAER